MEELEYLLRDTDTNKVYWLNLNNIKISGVAGLKKLMNLRRRHFYQHCENTILDYGSEEFDLGELNACTSKIFKRAITKEKYEVDLGEVDGFSASKSNLDNYISMESFVEECCRKYFEISEEALQHNFNWNEVRINTRDRTSDHFIMFGWSERFYLANGGGSHHFASAQYIANKLGLERKIRAIMHFEYLDQVAVQEFCHTYQAILIPKHDFAYMQGHLDRSGINAIGIPLSHESTDAVILIYKQSEVPERIDSLFISTYTDFNNELLKFVAIQEGNKKFQRHLKLADIGGESAFHTGSLSNF